MMKRLVLSSIFTLAVTLGIVSTNNITVQAAAPVASMDFDQNNRIDILDLASLADRCNLKKNNTNARYDLNGDGTIDLYDLVEVSAAVGTKINKVADTTNITSKFTDTGFKIYIYNLIGKNMTQPILYSDVKNITTLNLQNRWIRNLNGIEYFTGLTKVDASNNLLTNLDLSSNVELREINVNNNYLTSLNLSSNSRLTKLSCSINYLTNLDLSMNVRLSSLSVSENYLTALDLSRNTKLTSLNCVYNRISSLNVSNSRELTNLNCSVNRLASLDLTRNTALVNLNTSYNYLTNLELGNNGALVSLNCTENNIKSLDISKNIKLTYLECTRNEIKTLYSIKDSWNSNGYKFQYTDANHKKTSPHLKITVRVFS